MKLILTILFSILLFNTSFSQRNDLSFRVLDNSNGLPQNSVYAMVQDSLGFIWIGTEDGLVRFDGDETMLIDKSNHKYSNLSSNEIVSLQHDWPFLWIGTENGLNSYNIVTEEITSYFDKVNFSSPIKSMAIAPKKDILWLGTSDGLYVYDYSNLSNKINKVNDNFAINDMFYSNNDYLILATDLGLLIKYLDTGEIDTITEGKYNIINTNNNNNLFVLSDNNIIYSLSDGNDRLTQYLKLEDKEIDITDFCFYNEKILICTSNNGLLYNNNWNQYFGIESNSLPEDHLLCNYIDNTGVLWIGTDTKGVCFNDPRTVSLKHYTISPFTDNNEYFLPENIVWSFGQIDSNKIVIGLNQSGAVLFDKNSKKFNRLQTDFDDFSNSSIKAIATINGSLLFGTDKGKIFSCGRDYKLRLHASINKKEEIKIIKKISSEKIGIGTNKYLYVYSSVSHIIDTIKIGDIYAIEKCLGDSTLFVGTKGNGMFTVNTNDFSFRKLSDKVQNILAIHKPKNTNNLLIIGTKDFGLLEYNILKNEYNMKPLIDDKNANVVHSIVPGSDSLIWLSTNNGIYLYNYISKGYNSFSNIPSLQNKEFCGGSSFIDFEGKIYFGGINGYNLIDDDLYNQQSSNLSKYYTYFSMFKSISNDPTIRNSFSLDSNVVLKRYFKVKYEDRPISFRINTVDYNNSDFEYLVFVIDNSGKYIKLDPVNESNVFSLDYAALKNLALVYGSDNYEIIVYKTHKIGLSQVKSTDHFTIMVGRAPLSYMFILVSSILFLGFLIFFGWKAFLLVRKINNKYKISTANIKHQENINEIRNITNINNIIYNSIVQLVKNYQYVSAAYFDFSYSKNKFVTRKNKNNDSELIQFFTNEEEKKLKFILTDSGHYNLFYEDQLLRPNESYIINNILIFPCSANFEFYKQNEESKLLRGVFGIFLCKLPTYSFSAVKGKLFKRTQPTIKFTYAQSRSYLDNISQVLSRLKINAFAKEIEEEFNNLELNSVNHEDFLLRLIAYINSRFGAIHDIKLNIISFGFSTGLTYKTLGNIIDSNNEDLVINSEIEVYHNNVIVFNFVLFTIGEIRRELKQHIKSLFERSVDTYFNLKYDFFIGKLIHPIRLFETYQIAFQKSSKSSDSLMEPFLDLLKNYFNTDFISFWIKVYDDDDKSNYYIQKYGTEEVKKACHVFGERKIDINYSRKYYPYVIDLSMKSEDNEQFYSFAKDGSFQSCIYVPLIIEKLQYGYILIYSKLKISDVLFHRDLEFINLISEKAVRFVQDRKLVKYKKTFNISSFISLKTSLEVLTKNARNYLFPDFVILFWYPDDNSDRNNKYRKDFICSGEENLKDKTIITRLRKNINAKIDVIDTFITNKVDLIWVDTKEEYNKHLGTKQKKLENTGTYNDWFFYRENVKTLIAAPIVYNGIKIGVILLNYLDTHFRRNIENDYMIKSFIKYISEGFENAKYFDLFNQRHEIAKIKAEVEEQKNRKLELEFKDIEEKRVRIEEELRLTLSKFSDYSQFLMFKSIFHDVRRILNTQKKSLELINLDNLRDKERHIIEKELLRVDLNAKRIKDFLQLFSFTEKGKVEIDTKVDFEEVLQSLKKYFIRPYFQIDSVDPEQIIVFNILNKQEESERFYCKKTLISMSFYNIVSNAIEVLSDIDDKTDKKIDIIINFENNHHKIVIKDNGPGLDYSKVDETSIFEYGETSKDDGLGLGLFFVKDVIENKYNGSVDFKRKNGFSEFTIILPYK